MDESSTIAAVATAPGRGGVAVVRVSGPEAFDIAATLTGRRVDAACAGRFFHATLRHGGKTLDDGLVLVFAAPASYTGEDVVEFQTHGGVVAPRRVLDACLACGARLARRGEFTQRAFQIGAYTGKTAGGVEIDTSWCENDGLVNTISEKAPLGAPSKPFDRKEIEAGMWNVLPTLEADHMWLQGGLMRKHDIRDFYTRLIKMIDALA